LDQPLLRLPPPESDDDDDDEDDGGADSVLVIGRSGGGIKESFGEGGIAGFSDGVICDTHLANQSAATPDASPSSSNMVEGLLAIFLIYSVVTCNLFFISFSTCLHCSFIQLVKASFSVWYYLSHFSFWACSKKELSLGCSAQTTS
jgi:hypothetical protein